MSLLSFRQIVSHMAGIRHYEKKADIERKKEQKSLSVTKEEGGPTNKKTRKKEKAAEVGGGDGKFQEFHIKDHYDSIDKALELFKEDDLLSEPGTMFIPNNFLNKQLIAYSLVYWLSLVK